MDEILDCVVVGAGVIGLAIGRALALAGRQVIVIERNEQIGEETSSRNSEVIHAGLYYPTGSLKARLCVRGKELLYAYCEQRRIPHRRCGKLLVATEESQRAQLARIAQQAQRNGVYDLVEVAQSAIHRYEPAVRAVHALWSPSTGIIDSHALMLALAADIEQADGLIATHTRVDAITVRADSLHLSVCTQGEPGELAARTVINAAGLGAADLAAACSGVTDYTVATVRFARGNYFSYAGRNPFRSLVYPIPVAGGLGIHATLDLGGGLRFGPDVEWVDRIDYTVDPARAAAFAEAIRRYWPDVDAQALTPGYAGIRPKLAGPEQPAEDFRIDLPVSGAQRQLLHLFGIESPGLTAALAIAETVCSRLGVTSG